MAPCAWLRSSLVGLLVVFACCAQENPWIKLDGWSIEPTQPDNARALCRTAQVQLISARTAGKVTPPMEEVLKAAQRALDGREHDKAFQLCARLLTVLDGREVTEESEIAASYDFQVHKRIIAPGEIVRLRVLPVFSLGEKPLTGDYRVNIRVTDEKGREDFRMTPFPVKTVTVANATVGTLRARQGRYLAHFELTSGGKPLTSVSREFMVSEDLKPRIRALRTKIEKVREKLGSNPDAPGKAVLESSEYLVELLASAGFEYIGGMDHAAHARVLQLSQAGASPDPFRMPEDLVLAEELVESALAGKSRFDASGDFHLAVRSPEDRRVYPYRVYVPKDFQPERSYPLVVLLHGASGNENTFLGTWRNPLTELADRHGMILAAPSGRGAFPDYREAGGRDVLEVLDQVSALFPVARDRVFLAGDAAGVLAVGFQNPGRFRALAPIGAPEVPLDIAFDAAAGFPVLWTSSESEPFESLRVPLAAKAKAGLTKLRELRRSEDPLSMVPAALPAIFDFLQTQR